MSDLRVRRIGGVEGGRESKRIDHVVDHNNDDLSANNSSSRPVQLNMLAWFSFRFSIVVGQYTASV
jgi:hypothetical protein